MLRAVRLSCKISGKPGWPGHPEVPQAPRWAQTHPGPPRSHRLWRKTALQLKAAQETGLFVFIFFERKKLEWRKTLQAAETKTLGAPGLFMDIKGFSCLISVTLTEVQASLFLC